MHIHITKKWNEIWNCTLKQQSEEIWIITFKELCKHTLFWCGGKKIMHFTTQCDEMHHPMPFLFDFFNLFFSKMFQIQFPLFFLFNCLLLHGKRMQVDNGACCRHSCGFIFHGHSALKKLGKNSCMHSATKIVRLGWNQGEENPPNYSNATWRCICGSGRGGCVVETFDVFKNSLVFACVATLALGSQPRQKGFQGRRPIRRVWEWRLTLPSEFSFWELESRWTLEPSKRN